ncbi:hypothetical protein SteCoe_13798 [Stentor coeruleus]|uniref:GST C-terminal domain-containing protein n=1 Tax=Stentor coeruleus TaxID=5963 RepID=A0A1R2C7I4_9CILI|nr:hypothetical protein SteCoe_13798 [Stentor coeruleus]
MADIEDLIPDGKYFGYKALGKDEMMLIDLLALPLIERIIVFKDLELSYYQGVNLQNCLNWYSRMKQLLYVKAHEMPPIRYIKYKNLFLPVSSYYDLPPKP